MNNLALKVVPFPKPGALITALMLTTLLTTLFTTTRAIADDTPRSDKHYIGILATALEHRSLGYHQTLPYTKEDGWSQAGTLVVGGHITDYAHAELRFGGGYSDAEISDDLTLSVDYFASWYMGLHYPITEYANVYGQGGFSYIHGEADLENRESNVNRQYRYLDEQYPASSFGLSWLVGLDFELFDDAFLVFEGGRLFKDTDSYANTFQFSSGLRYEF